MSKIVIKLLFALRKSTGEFLSHINQLFPTVLIKEVSAQEAEPTNPVEYCEKQPTEDNFVKLIVYLAILILTFVVTTAIACFFQGDPSVGSHVILDGIHDQTAALQIYLIKIRVTNLAATYYLPHEPNKPTKPFRGDKNSTTIAMDLITNDDKFHTRWVVPILEADRSKGGDVFQFKVMRRHPLPKEVSKIRIDHNDFKQTLTFNAIIIKDLTNNKKESLKCAMHKKDRMVQAYGPFIDATLYKEYNVYLLHYKDRNTGLTNTVSSISHSERGKPEPQKDKQVQTDELFDELEDVSLSGWEQVLMIFLGMSGIVLLILNIPEDICALGQHNWASRGGIAGGITVGVILVIWFAYYQTKRQGLDSTIFSICRWFILTMLITGIGATWYLTGVRVQTLTDNGIQFVAQASALGFVIFILTTYLFVYAGTWLFNYLSTSDDDDDDELDVEAGRG